MAGRIDLTAVLLASAVYLSGWNIIGRCLVGINSLAKALSEVAHCGARREKKDRG